MTAVTHTDAAAPKPLPLTPEQKETADKVVADKKASDEKAAAIAKANADYAADIAAAQAKRAKALEKYVVIDVAEAAWEATKDPADPLWKDVQRDYKAKLETVAADVEANGLISETPTAFEVKVDELVTAAKEVKEKEKPVKALDKKEK